MKQEKIVIFADSSIASIVSAIQNGGEVTTIDISDKEKLLSEAELSAIKDASLIVVQYVAESLPHFVKEFADGLRMRNVNEESDLPKFQILYDRSLRKTPILLQGLISSTSETYLSDMMYPFLTVYDDKMFEPAFKGAEPVIVGFNSIESVLHSLKEAGNK